MKGLPKLSFTKDPSPYGLCLQGKKTLVSHKVKNLVSTSKCLELLHVDLVGPMQTRILNGKKYIFVIVNNYSRYMWVLFLSHKGDVFEVFKSFAKKDYH